jgi:hypothetical protein
LSGWFRHQKVRSLSFLNQLIHNFPKFLWKARKRIFAIILLTTVSSFVFCLIKSYSQPTEAFYSPASRFWEILLGGLLAYLTAFVPRILLSESSMLNNLKSILGFILIGIAVFSLSRQLSFPGLWALLPTCGAFLIIAAGPSAWLNRVLLSNQLMVWIGLISFPLYLWHWPLLTFVRMIEFGPPSTLTILVIVTLSFLLAWLTYVGVEKKIRILQMRFIPLRMGLTMIAVAGVGFYIYTQDGALTSSQKDLASRMQVNWDQYYQSISTNFPACLPQKLQAMVLKHEDTVRCRQTVSANPNHTIVLIGDSHAEQLFAGIANQISPNENLVYLTNGCMPFLGLTGKSCKSMEETLDYILNEPSVRVVVLSQYWAFSAYFPVSRLSSDPQNNNTDEIFKHSMKETLKALTAAGKSVIFAYDTPSISFDPKKCMRKAFQPKNTPENCVVDRKYVDNYHHVYRELANEVLKEFPQVKTWDPLNLLCNRDVCHLVKDGHLMYLDDNHITVFTSLLLGKSLNDEISSAMKL